MRTRLTACMVVAVTAAVLSVSLSSGAPTRAAACPMSHVRYTSATVAEGIPWVASANGKITGHLFYYGAVSWGKDRLVGARIFTSAKQHTFNPKILWVTRARGYGVKVTIRGQRIDAPGSFSQTESGWGDYPSIVDVRAAGCWRVTVTTGPVSGRFVFSALDY